MSPRLRVFLLPAAGGPEGPRPDRRRRQVVRQRSAKPPSPVQIRAAPPKILSKFAPLVVSARRLAISYCSEQPSNSLLVPKSDVGKALHREELSARALRKGGIPRTSAASRLPRALSPICSARDLVRSSVPVRVSSGPSAMRYFCMSIIVAATLVQPCGDGGSRCARQAPFGTALRSCCALDVAIAMVPGIKSLGEVDVHTAGAPIDSARRSNSAAFGLEWTTDNPI